MSKSPVTIIVATFSSDDVANAALDQLKSPKKDIGLHGAANVRRDGDKVKVKETKNMGGGKGTVIGGVLAGIATGGLSILGNTQAGRRRGHDRQPGCRYSRPANGPGSGSRGRRACSPRRGSTRGRVMGGQFAFCVAHQQRGDDKALLESARPGVLLYRRHSRYNDVIAEAFRLRRPCRKHK